MGRPWAVGGFPMVDHWFTPFGCWWAARGMPMGCPCDARGMPMGCPWDARGTVSNPIFIKKINNVYLPYEPDGWYSNPGMITSYFPLKLHSFSILFSVDLLRRLYICRHVDTIYDVLGPDYCFFSRLRGSISHPPEPVFMVDTSRVGIVSAQKRSALETFHRELSEDI